MYQVFLQGDAGEEFVGNYPSMRAARREAIRVARGSPDDVAEVTYEEGETLAMYKYQNGVVWESSGGLGEWERVSGGRDISRGRVRPLGRHYQRD